MICKFFCLAVISYEATETSIVVKRLVAKLMAESVCKGLEMPNTFDLCLEAETGIAEGSTEELGTSHHQTLSFTHRN